MSIEVEVRYCDCCDDACFGLVPDPHDVDRMLCPICRAEQVAEEEAEAKEQAIGEAEDEVNEAEYELETLLDDLKNLKEQIAGVRHTLRCAKSRLRHLNK